MDLLEKIISFANEIKLAVAGKTNSKFTNDLNNLIIQARHFNHWFTQDTINLRLTSIARFLGSESFTQFFKNIYNPSNHSSKIFGVISEENIPVEEFPVLLTIMTSGNSFVYKTYEKSDKIIQLLFSELAAQIPELYEKIKFTDGILKNTDVIIKTQPQNIGTAQADYFKNKKTFLVNRCQSAVVISGNETNEELRLLGNDIFSFFCQGAGNVRKIYAPVNYDFNDFFRAIEPWNIIMENSKWANNYQYHQSVFLMNQIEHLDNGFILLKKDTGQRSPSGVLYYDAYTDMNDIRQKLSVSGDIYNIYISSPLLLKEKAFGDSANQLLVPSKDLLNFIYERK